MTPIKSLEETLASVKEEMFEAHGSFRTEKSATAKSQNE